MFAVQENNNSIINNCTIGFLSHFARTGSTLLSDRLNRHEEVVLIPEAKILKIIKNYFNNLSKFNHLEIIDILFLDIKFKNWKLDKQNLINYFNNKKIENWQTFLYFLFIFYKDKYKPNAKIIIFKKLESHKYFDDFQKFYKEAFIIFLTRDPRAVYSSSINLKHSISGKFFFDNIFDISIKWNAFSKAIFKSNFLKNKNAKIIKYEYMIENFNESLLSLLNFFGLKNIESNKNLEFLNNKKKNQLIFENDRHLHHNVKKNIMQNNNYKWINKMSFLNRLSIFILCFYYMGKFKYKF